MICNSYVSTCNKCGVPLLLDRIKQSMVSCKVSVGKSVFCTLFKEVLTQETSAFFKKRAIIEDEYGKTLQKLARSTSELYAVNDGKAGLVCSFLCFDGVSSL